MKSCFFASLIFSVYLSREFKINCHNFAYGVTLYIIFFLFYVILCVSYIEVSNVPSFVNSDVTTHLAFPEKRVLL